MPFSIDMRLNPEEFEKEFDLKNKDSLISIIKEKVSKYEVSSSIDFNIEKVGKSTTSRKIEFNILFF